MRQVSSPGLWQKEGCDGPKEGAESEDEEGEYKGVLGKVDHLWCIIREDFPERNTFSFGH